MPLRLHPCSVAPAEDHEKCGPNRPSAKSSCNNASTQRRGHDGQVKQGEQEVLHARDSVGQTSGVTQRCLNPEFSETIGNSRRTDPRDRGRAGPQAGRRGRPPRTWSSPPIWRQALDNRYKDQLERIDRLMTIVEADNPHNRTSGLDPIDIIVFACQSMWHLKDWIVNDAHFGARDIKELKSDIHASRCLLVCADLANGSKHLSLTYPKVGARLSEHSGFHYEPSKGICRDIYYVVCPDPSDEYHGIEVRNLLRCCRNEWQKIINRHYLSKIDDDWAVFVNELPTS